MLREVRYIYLDTVLGMYDKEQTEDYLTVNTIVSASKI